MYTLTLLICCTGFFCLYNTSKRAMLSRTGYVQAWLQAHQQPVRLIGAGCLSFTFICLVCMDGGLMGILNALLMVMAAGCYIIGLAPFGLFRWNHIIALGVIAFLLEFLIF